MKKCPYCNEYIADEVVVCEFCNRDLLVAVDGEIEAQTSERPKMKKRKIRFRRVLVYAMGFAVFESIATVISAVCSEAITQNGRTIWTDLVVDASYSLILAVGFGIILGLFDSSKIKRWVFAGVIAGCLIIFCNTFFNHFLGKMFVSMPDYRTLFFVQSIYTGLLLGISFGIAENNGKRSYILAGTIIICYLTIGMASNGMYHTYYLFLADAWSIRFDVMVSLFFGGLIGFFVGLAKELGSLYFIKSQQIKPDTF